MSDWEFQFVLHLVESTLFASLLWGFVWVMRMEDSNVRCWLLRICLLKFALPSVWLFGLIDWGIGFTETLEGNVIFGPLQQAATSFRVDAEVAGAATLSGNLFTPGLLGIWFVGFVVVSVVLLVSSIRFHWRIRRESSPFGGREKRVLAVCRDERRVEGIYIESGPSVGLYGIFQPRIIARSAFLENLDDEELKAAMRHEVAHLNRRDNLWSLVFQIANCVFWFHPLFYILNRQMRFEMEKACDEWAFSTLGRTSGYARCLLKAAEYGAFGGPIGTLALSESFLKRRIRNILEEKKIEYIKMKLLSVGLFVIALCGGSVSIAAFAAEKGEDRVFEHSVEGELTEAIDTEKLEAEYKKMAKTLALMERQLEQTVMQKEQLEAEYLAKALEQREVVIEAAMKEKAEIIKSANRVRERMLKEIEEEKEAMIRRMTSDDEYADLDRDIELETDDRTDDALADRDIERGAERTKDVYALRELDVKPRAIYQVDPKYPGGLMEDNVEGWSVIEWVIDREGDVREVRVVSSSHEPFGEPAADAIAQSRWKPGKIDGKAVNVRVRQKLKFELKKADLG